MSQHYRLLRVLGIEGVMLATALAASLWTVLPGDLKREHSIEPLNHPSDGLAEIQESMIVLENK